MDLLQMGAQILSQQLGGNANSDSLQNVLGSLIGDGDSMDIASLVAKMQGGSGGLAEIVQSWLGDGENAAISPSQLQDVIDTDRLQQSASQLGNRLQYTKTNPSLFPFKSTSFSPQLSHFLNVSHAEHHISLKRVTS